ncbi:hypothetical protein F4680DRAFT_399514 [Xylaria scruposa]|nr:hypothetical protein F4680DRAFT_399514 [Xylaria scruposa]
MRRSLFGSMDDILEHRRYSLLVFTVALALGTFIIRTFHSSDLWAEHTMAQPFFLSHLQLNVTQSPVAEPAISVSVTNTHSSTPVTFLKWDSPLDSAALGLGLVHVIPAGTTQPVHINSIKISRLMPPKGDSLVTLLPGESATNTVELRDPIVPKRVWDTGPAKVRMSGRWMAVWPELTKEDVLSDTQRLQSVGAGVGSLIGNWETEYVELTY